MNNQITHHIMMIRPVDFHLNLQTAVNNHYQKNEREGASNPQQEALVQFDAFVDRLRDEGVEVTVFEDTAEPSTPDSIFPNNWVSFHEEGIICLYPMFAENRRLERREDIITFFQSHYPFDVVINYSDWEARGRYLEGTGSLILDRQHRIAYAALSERTNREVLDRFSEKSGFKIVSFHAYQSVNGRRLPIYHTNVMMCLGEQFAVVCLDAIDDKSEKENLLDSLHENGKEVIEISAFQKAHFAGNMLQLKTKDDRKLVVMSTQAFHSLEQEQLERLQLHGKIVHSDIHTIETLGGGSARCMMAEIFSPKLN